MPEEKKDNRPFWKKKTTYGLLLLGISRTMAFFPVTLPFSPLVETAGIILAGYGISDRISKK